MTMQRSRREFLRDAAFTGAGLTLAEGAFAQTKSKSPNEKINFACIGVGGKGDSDSSDAGNFGNVVAICDVDENTLNRKGQQFPNAKKFTDYRKMLDAMRKEIDGVTVSVPDHSHGPAAAMALHMGKAVYCQKPMAHSIHEVRTLSELARKMKVATQMGNQGTADNSMRANAYKVRAGAVGVVKEVHVWTNRPIWPQGLARRASKMPPANLDWNLWLGPAATRDYADGYHTFSWRGWWDFGTGALGDMACHTVNLPFMALDLRNPTSVYAETVQSDSKENPKAGFHDSYPASSKIVFEFPANKTRPALTMYWYDGNDYRPAKDLFHADGFSDLIENDHISDSGSLIVGDKGSLYTPGDYGGGGHIVGGTNVGDADFPHSPGHWEEFVRAIRASNPLDPKDRAMSNFPEYAGPLAETILLGNLAVWTPGKKVEWNAKTLQAKNLPESEHIIRPKYRAGYSL